MFFVDYIRIRIENKNSIFFGRKMDDYSMLMSLKLSGDVVALRCAHVGGYGCLISVRALLKISW